MALFLESPANLTVRVTGINIHTFLTVPEQLVYPFKFYFNGTVYEGVRHSNDLYGLLHDYEVHQRLVAYENAVEQVKQGNVVLMTVSFVRYRSWVSLRSPGASAIFKSPVRKDV